MMENCKVIELPVHHGGQFPFVLMFTSLYVETILSELIHQFLLKQ